MTEQKWKRIASITIDLEAPEGSDEGGINALLDDLELTARLLRSARQELGQVGGALAGVRCVSRFD